jgi:hypothetical protein
MYASLRSQKNNCMGQNIAEREENTRNRERKDENEKNMNNNEEEEKKNRKDVQGIY